MSVPRPLRLAPVLLAATLAPGCDAPFEPYAENTVGPFSVFAYLDLKADTQWVRVSPIRQNLLTDSAAIDAVVTLEHLGSGRVVTLRDSVFAFLDRRLDAAGYGHNFWTTEPLEPEATYRLAVVRSDGAATTATVEMPAGFEVDLRFQDTGEPGGWVPRQMFVESEHQPLYTEVLYTVWDSLAGRPAPPFTIRLTPRTADPGRWGFDLPGVSGVHVEQTHPLEDKLRREARIAVAGSDWPIEPGLSDTEYAMPGNIPTTVENGVGLVLGVAIWTIPLLFCDPIEARPDGRAECDTRLDASSASIVGRVTRGPCGAPAQLTSVRLTERYADGGAVVWAWLTDWGGAYRFDGIEPGSDLLLEVGGHPSGATDIPALGPGERYIAPHVTIPSGC